MATMWLRRTLNGFVPAPGVEIPKTWKVGDDLRAEVTKPRNAKHHRKAFILLQVVFPHTDYPSIEALRLAMTVGAGFVETIINPMTGEVALTPKSWRFDKMDQDEFVSLYRALIGVALKLVEGSKEADWWNAVEDIARL